MVAKGVQMNPEPTTRCDGDAMDQLSALPDGLLHVIMSFLPAPQVVQTSLLSRRWRCLWRSTLCIEIDSQDFEISAVIRDGTLSERWARFEDFATNLLLFHDNTSFLGEFRLRSLNYNWRHVQRWIRRGFEYCPAVVQIQILGNDTSVVLPPVSDSSFHRLKRLRLSRVILDRHFTSCLSSACPFLEDLDLQFCEFSGICSQGIVSPTLKTLEMEDCLNKTCHPLVITAPSLTYLSLAYGCYLAGISLCKMDSLVKARIYIREYQTLSQENQCELLGSLFNVTNLELLGFEAEVMLNENHDKFPIFSNMRTLDLYTCFLDEYELNEKLEALGSFLHNAPCLEKLTLEYCMFISFSNSEWEIERKTIALHRQHGRPFQCQKLKLVEVIYDYDHDHQLMELVWSLARSLPDASIILKKIERYP